MRAFGRSASSQRVTTSSRALRASVLLVPKYRFLASCCVIVLPPRVKRPLSTFFWIDSSIAFQSTPSCPKKPWSSEERTAWMRWRETRESGTHDCTGAWAFRPLASASSARCTMRRVRPGFFVASALTSDRAGRPAHTQTASAARTVAAARARREGEAAHGWRRYTMNPWTSS